MKLNERGWLTTRHRNWLFFRPFHNKNPSIFITIFKNRIFVVLHKQKPSFFGVNFWSVGPGRVGSGRVADWPKCEKIVVRFELKTLMKPSIYQLSKWSNKPFKVHFSIWFLVRASRTNDKKTQQESVDFHHHFLKSHFCRPTQAKTVIFRGHFLVGRAGSGRVAFRPKCEKNAFRFEPKTLIKPSIYQLSKWSNKPFKVHFSIWYNTKAGCELRVYYRVCSIKIAILSVP